MQFHIGRPHLERTPDLGMFLTYSYPGQKKYKEPILLPSTDMPYGAQVYQHFKSLARLAFEEKAKEGNITYADALNSFMKESLEGTLELLEDPPKELLQEGRERAFVEILSQGARRVYALYGDEHGGKENRSQVEEIVKEYAEKIKSYVKKEEFPTLVKKVAKHIGETLLKLVEREQRIGQGEPLYLQPKWGIDL